MTGIFGVSGAVTRSIPADAATGSKLPAVSCYTSNDGQTWLIISHTPTIASGLPFCGLVGTGTASPGVQIVNGASGWLYHITVTW